MEKNKPTNPNVAEEGKTQAPNEDRKVVA